MASKTEGYKDKVVGAVKENTGYVVGNERMEAEGKVQRMKGTGEVETAKAEQVAKGTTEQIKGNIKEFSGKVLGNERMEAEGKVDRLTGNARKEANQ